MATRKMKDPLADHDVFITTELVNAALQELKFLQKINETSELHSKETIHRAILRYEKYWLPLAADNLDEKIAPPLDVHWVWHCHMLAPHRYQEDCKKIVGIVVDHLPNLLDNSSARDLCEKLWSEKFPHEPYHLTTINKEMPYEKISGYNLENAAERQASFYYNVSLPHYRAAGYLKDAFKRYCRFLFLKKSYPKCFTVPTYDIDLLWHTHQLCPSAYKRDTEATLGRLLIHDDTDTDRSAGSYMVNSFEETKSNWYKLYGEVYSRPGGMYRGPTPNKFFGALIASPNHTHLFTLDIKSFCDVLIEKDLLGFWGPAPLSGVTPPVRALVADHKLDRSEESENLAARIAHSVDTSLQLSCMQLLQDGKMLAVAHTAGLEQIPLPSMPNDTMMPVPVLRYHIGERAILIKDSEGDWGICFGCWSNKKPFYNRWLNSLTNLIPGVGEDSVESYAWREDEFVLRLYEIRSKTWTQSNIKRNDCREIKLPYMDIDMHRGTIQIEGSCNDVASRVCLGFGVAMLLTMALPCPTSCAECLPGHLQDDGLYSSTSSGSDEDYDTTHKNKAIKTGMKNKMLESCGYFVNFRGRVK